MNINELDGDTCWDLWAKINANPVKTARVIFPEQPPMYVSITKLIAGYAANRGTALNLSDNISAAKTKKLEDDIKSRVGVYQRIATRIYNSIPIQFRSFNMDFLKEK